MPKFLVFILKEKIALHLKYTVVNFVRLEKNCMKIILVGAEKKSSLRGDDNAGKLQGNNN